VQGEITVWDTETRQLVWRGDSRLRYWAVTCSPTEDILAAVGHEGHIEIWDFSDVRKNK
jgi:hypothetical protein